MIGKDCSKHFSRESVTIGPLFANRDQVTMYKRDRRIALKDVGIFLKQTDYAYSIVLF